MVGKALGLIETVGLAAAMEAADAAVKSAAVCLIGYELTKGGGLVTVKLLGDVGAVKAAVQAGAAAAGRINKVWASHVIPRPHQELESLLETKETVGCRKTPNSAEPTASREETKEDTGSEDLLSDGLEENKVVTEELNEEINEEVTEEAEGAADETMAATGGISCNLCGDPACTRVKGDSKTQCLHYGRPKK